jgi:steroid delta-isomerase-like uncharacterized protein
MHRRSLAQAGAAFALAGPITSGRFADSLAAEDGDAGALPAPLAGWVAAWEAQPLAAEPAAAAYVEDAVYEEVATGVIRTGHGEILAYLTDFFAAFADASAKVEVAFAVGEHGAATWTFTGNYTGQLPGFPPGTGQPITFRGASMLDLRDGMILRETQFFDVYGLLVQLGIVPAPVGTPVP